MPMAATTAKMGLFSPWQGRHINRVFDGSSTFEDRYHAIKADADVFGGVAYELANLESIEVADLRRAERASGNLRIQTGQQRAIAFLDIHEQRARSFTSAVRAWVRWARADLSVPGL